MNKKAKQKPNVFLTFPDRKGIMVKFLVTVLLAIIIFLPACMFVSKVFQLSDQAVDSFNDFHKEIVKVSEAGAGSKGSFLLKMDAGTAIIKFDKGKNVYGSTLKPEKLKSIYEEWKSPGVEEVSPPSTSEFNNILVKAGSTNLNDYEWITDKDILSDNNLPAITNRYFLFRTLYESPQDECKEKNCLLLCQNIGWSNIKAIGQVNSFFGADFWVYTKENFCKQSKVIFLEEDIILNSFSISRSENEQQRRILAKLENKEGVVHVTFQ